jgi:riboflavin kinase/FMN adenylyltransferase
MGFPTANLRPERAFCIPKDGVYAGKAVLSERKYPCAINIGSNPTFGDVETALEVFLIDFDGEIYGESVEVEFHHRLRDEVKFATSEALTSQMRRDVEEARDLMSASD